MDKETTFALLGLLLEVQNSLEIAALQLGLSEERQD